MRQFLFFLLLIILIFSWKWATNDKPLQSPETTIWNTAVSECKGKRMKKICFVCSNNLTTENYSQSSRTIWRCGAPTSGKNRKNKDKRNRSATATNKNRESKWAILCTVIFLVRINWARKLKKWFFFSIFIWQFKNLFIHL